MTGLDDPATVDLVTQNSEGDVALILVQAEPWSAAGHDVTRLREKLNNYATYALDGQLVDTYPEASGARVRIQVDSVEEPTGDVAELLATARRGLAKHSIDLTTNIITI